MQDLELIALQGKAGELLNSYISMTSGVVLGLLFALMLSGQLRGIKPDSSIEQSAKRG
jgi:hypothetical protein